MDDASMARRRAITQSRVEVGNNKDLFLTPMEFWRNSINFGFSKYSEEFV